MTAWPEPVEFRLRYLKDARDIAVIKAAAEKADAAPKGDAFEDDIPL